MLIVLGMMGILMGIGATNLAVLDNPLQNATNEVAGFLKQARARAVSSSTAYRVYPTNARQLVAEFGLSCDDPSPQLDVNLHLDLPKGVSIPDTNWEICFTSRGLATSSPTLYFYGPDYATKSVEVFLGGAVRVTS